MTDHELLERAARAIGGKYSHGNHADGSMTGYLEVGDEIEYWNPLDNDGDAFHLAQRLSLNVAFKNGYGGGASEPSSSIYCVDVCKDDPATATRRAIVRAAAAIAGDA